MSSWLEDSFNEIPNLVYRYKLKEKREKSII